MKTDNRPSGIDWIVTDDEHRRIEVFKKRAAQLAQVPLIKEGRAQISAKIRGEEGKGVNIAVTLPPETDLRALYMAFRFFYLQREPAYFLRIVKILRQHTNDHNTIAYLDYLKKQWIGSLRKQIEIVAGGRSLTPSLLIDLWFNAYFFHSDEKKESELNKMLEITGRDFGLFLLTDAVYEAARAVISLNSKLDIIDLNSNKSS